jgi:iron complex transport system ATP-binding protein
MIAVERVSKRFEQGDVLENVDFTVQTGEFFGIIGPNGSGKSTLLRLISGVEAPSEGTVRLRGREVRSYPRKQLARWLAVLQQDSLPPVGFTVREVVEMGRYPFQNWLGEEPEDPTGWIDSILSRLGLESLSGRGLDQLSGGERQRVALGQVMAQQPELLLLDEPTTYLDIGYQVQMMDYVRGWQRDTGLTVVAVLHDLNLAAQYCDRILVLHRGRMIRLGPPEEVICADLIESVYGTRPLVLAHPANAVPQILLMPGS